MINDLIKVSAFLNVNEAIDKNIFIVIPYKVDFTKMIVDCSIHKREGEYIRVWKDIEFLRGLLNISEYFNGQTLDMIEAKSIDEIFLKLERENYFNS